MSVHMRKKINEYIDNLEYRAKQSDKFFVERNELYKKNHELQQQINELQTIINVKKDRKLIHKFDEEFDKEDKNKNPKRKYAVITPDAEEVYKRYYAMKSQQQEFIKYLEHSIKTLENDQAFRFNHSTDFKLSVLKNNLQKYKEIIGVDKNETRRL